MSAARRGLSKSRIMAGLQCPRRLWLIAYRPQAAVWSAESRRRLAVGHSLGEAARGLYPGGELIDEGNGGLRRALALTRARLAQPADLTLFEPAFERDGTLVRVDVLQRRGGRLPHGRGQGVVGPEGLPGHRRRRAGVGRGRVGSPALGGRGARGHVVRVRGRRRLSRAAQRGRRHPATCSPSSPACRPWRPDCAHARRRRALEKDPGRRCFDPFPCEFFADCGLDDAEYPVTLLPGDLQLVAELVADGYADLRDVPLDRLTDPVHRRLWRAAAGGTAELRSRRRPASSRRLPYPAPLLRGGGAQPVGADVGRHAALPDAAVPVLLSPSGAAPATSSLDHAEFLDTSGADPAPAFAEAALAALGEDGPIVVYGRPGARRPAVAGGAPARPAPTGWARPSAASSTSGSWSADHYYHPDMRGSFALHDVARPRSAARLVPRAGRPPGWPVGADAWAALAGRAPEAADWDEQRRAAVRQALLAACAADTLAVARLVRFLEGAAGHSD